MTTTQEANLAAASYKCDDCGKIIAAPVDQRPRCCGQPMLTIRNFVPDLRTDALQMPLQWN